jgi:hypothetical protein
VKFYHRGDGDAGVTPDGEFTVAISRHSVPSCPITHAFSGFSAAAAPPPPLPNSSFKSGLTCSVCFLLAVHKRSFKISNSYSILASWLLVRILNSHCIA